jgi:hypothetical protein
MAKVTRVKCANCGFIYDKVETTSGELIWATVACDKCGSNASDPIRCNKHTLHPAPPASD